MPQVATRTPATYNPTPNSSEVFEGAAFRARRRSLGLTQSDLADLTKICGATVSRFELGYPTRKSTRRQLLKAMNELDGLATTDKPRRLATIKDGKTLAAESTQAPPVVEAVEPKPLAEASVRLGEMNKGATKHLRALCTVMEMMNVNTLTFGVDGTTFELKVK